MKMVMVPDKANKESKSDEATYDSLVSLLLVFLRINLHWKNCKKIINKRKDLAKQLIIKEIIHSVLIKYKQF